MKPAILWFAVMVAGAIGASLAAASLLPHMVAYYDARHTVDFRVGLTLPFHVVWGARNGWPLLITVWALVAILAVGGWQLGKSVLRLGRIGLWAVVVAQIILGLILTLFPTTFSGDPYAYVIWTRLFGVHGLNPYLLFAHVNASGDPTLLRSLQFYGNPPPADDHGPLWTLIGGGIARLEIHASLWSQVWTHRLIALAAAVATSLGLLRLMRTAAVADRIQRLAAFSLNPLVVYEASVGAHDDMLMVALAVWAFAVVDELPLIAGLLMGASVSIKFVSVIAAPFLIIRAAKKGVLQGTLTLLVMAIVAVLCFQPFWAGTPTIYALLGHSGVLAMSPTWVLAHPFFRAGLGNVPAFSGIPTLPLVGLASWPRLIQLAFVCALVATLMISLVRYFHHRGSGEIWRSVAALIWSSPVIQPWYLLWLAPAAADTGKWARYAWWFSVTIFLRYALDATSWAYALPTWGFMALTVVMMAAPVGIAFLPMHGQRTAQRATTSAT